MSEPTVPDVASVEQLCADAVGLIEARRFAEAEAALTEARSRWPASAKVHYYLALLYGDVGRPSDALAALDQALALDDGDAKIHNNRGSVLHALGRLAEAEAAYRRALALRPDLGLPYLNLGKVLEARGRVTEAIATYDRALARGIDTDVIGQYRAAAAGVATPRSPDAWVRATFDNFAPTFDARLRELRYNVPSDLARLISARAISPLDILDLGCGTGQVGQALADRGHRLTGVDLSERMIAQARARGVYQSLVVAEVHAFLRTAVANSFDALCAADVFIYIGRLEDVFAEAFRILRPGGWFVFSTESTTAADYCLLPTGRYAQSDAYVRRLANGRFNVVVAQATIIRLESGDPIPGCLYLLERR